MDSLVSLYEAFVGLNDEWTINKVIKKKMTTILATATFCTFTKNLANVKTEVRGSRNGMTGR